MDDNDLRAISKSLDLLEQLAEDDTDFHSFAFLLIAKMLWFIIYCVFWKPQFPGKSTFVFFNKTYKEN